MGRAQELLFRGRILVGEVDLGQDGESVELALQDLQVVAQSKSAIFREQFVLARDVLARALGGLIDENAARQPDRQDQQQREDEGEFCP